jgi:hypothetical protein
VLAERGFIWGALRGRGARVRTESEILAEITLGDAPCLIRSVWEG